LQNDENSLCDRKPGYAFQNSCALCSFAENLDKLKLFSKIHGQGEPLIIMHGVFGMSDNWQTLGRKWSEDYQVHLLDMRNHGRSPHSDEFSYELMSDDLLEYLDQHKITRAHILGHSMGGKVAMLFAVLNEKRVNKLVVADIAPRPYEPHHQQIIEALKTLPLSEIESRSEAEEQFSIENYGVRQFLLKNLYWKEKGQLDWRFNLPVIAREIDKVGEGLAPQAIFNGPTLFIRGGNSDYIKDEDFHEIELHFPMAKLETIYGAGHWLHAEKPKEFYSQVTDFLQE
jgi:esterase